MKKYVKKLWSIILVVLLLVVFQGMQGVFAVRNTTLQINCSMTMELDATNSTQINFYTDASKVTLAGSLQVKFNDSPSFLTPNMYSGVAIYDLGSTNSASITVELMPGTGYCAPSSYNFGNNSIPLSSTNINLVVAGGTTGVLSLDFSKNNGANPPGPDGPDTPSPMVIFPVIAQFSGVNESVAMNSDGQITIPDGWTSGTVTFKAKTFRKDNGNVEPYSNQLTGGVVNEELLYIEGIANGEEIHETVTGNADRSAITISNSFAEFGKLLLHLVSGMDSSLSINQLLIVCHKDLINLKADAPLALSQSFGTVASNQAIITTDAVKSVKVFFGNSETTLIANGPNVSKITAVEGGSAVVLNADGTATVTLPSLSTETSTPIKVTILKNDSTTVVRNVIIARTAILLHHNYGAGDDTVYAGYVVNKGYLYNNQAHNDAVFNAYLQVILYKDNAVMGYKQIKIDDEELINNLQNDEAGSMELYSDKQIAVYGKALNNLIEGVNKVSVFLTNGPVSFAGDTLPTVEFGIGSGVTCEWEALS